jgi:hypothetical protein
VRELPESFCESRRVRPSTLRHVLDKEAGAKLDRTICLAGPISAASVAVDRPGGYSKPGRHPAACDMTRWFSCVDDSKRGYDHVESR